MTTTDDDLTPRAPRRAWAALAVLTLPTLLVAMDLTVLNLAVPALSADLRPSSSELLWIVDVYGFLIAGSLITMGTVGDRIGRRRLLLLGAAGFGAASVLAAFAPSAELLIAARALLGVAGATLMPSTLSLIRNLFADPALRTRAVAIWMSSFMVGTAIGPLVGGALLEWLWWGSVFLLGVPVMALLLALGPVLLPESRDPNAGRLDLASAALSLVAMLLVVFAVKRVAERGVDPLAVGALLGGLAVGAAFLARQLRLDDPLVDVRLLRGRVVGTALTTQAIVTLAMSGVQLLVVQHLQLVVGLSPLHAGLWTLPSTAVGIAAALAAPALARRRGVRPVAAVGLLVAAGGYAVVAQAGVDAGVAPIVVGFSLASLGLAPAMTLMTDTIVSAARPERAGSASALSETSGELGVALGIALLGSVGAAAYRARMTGVDVAALPADARAVAVDTLGGAAEVAGQLPPAVGAELLAAAREAFVGALQVTGGIAAALMVGLAAAVGALLRARVAAAARAG